MDEGDVTGISCPAVCLLLKPGAKAMIVWNLSQKVKNGSMGTFLRAQDNTLYVDIENHGTVLLKDKRGPKETKMDALLAAAPNFLLFCSMHVPVTKQRVSPYQGLKFNACQNLFQD